MAYLQILTAENKFKKRFISSASYSSRSCCSESSSSTSATKLSPPGKTAVGDVVKSSVESTVSVIDWRLRSVNSFGCIEVLDPVASEATGAFRAMRMSGDVTLQCGGENLCT